MGVTHEATRQRSYTLVTRSLSFVTALTAVLSLRLLTSVEKVELNQHAVEDQFVVLVQRELALFIP